MEFIQFLERLGYYFLNHENWLELFLYSFTLILLGPLGGSCVCPKSWEWQIGALAIFLAWIHLGIFVRKMPQLGLYVIMFEDIVITFIKIAIPALLLVLAFSMAFYMMFFVPSPLFAVRLKCNYCLFVFMQHCYLNLLMITGLAVCYSWALHHQSYDHGCRRNGL